MSANPSESTVIHEAVDERQHIRTPFPGRITLIDKTEKIDCGIENISLGGMGLKVKRTLKPGQMLDMLIQLPLKDATVTLDGKVRVIERRDDITGVEFVDMSQSRRDLLRHLITSYLSGEMVEVNGMLNVMQRENYVQKRKTKPVNQRSFRERLTALAGTLIYLVIGLVVAAILVHQLYVYLFRVQATSAFVSAPAFMINMPDDGYIDFLLAPEAKVVRTGQPIATVSARLQASLNTPGDLQALRNLDSSEVDELLGRTLIETVISSPCDCYVYYPAAPVDRFGYQGENMMQLLPMNDSLTITASFEPSEINQLRDADSIEIDIIGTRGTWTGKFGQFRLNQNSDLVEVTINPDTPLPRSAYLNPAEVRIYYGFSTLLPWTEKGQHPPVDSEPQ